MRSLLNALLFVGVSLGFSVDANAGEPFVNTTTCQIPQQSSQTTCDITVTWHGDKEGGGPILPPRDGGGEPLAASTMSSPTGEVPCLYHGNVSKGCGENGSVVVSVSQGLHFFVVRTPSGPMQANAAVSIGYAAYTPPFNWNSSSHKEIVGDFDNNGKNEIFVQPILKTSQSGLFPQVSTDQYINNFHSDWNGAHPQISAIEDWSQESYGAYVGDFNSNPGKELLLLGNKNIILLHGDIITPIVTFPQVNNAIVSWDASRNASHTEFEFDANPEDFEVVIGDLTGDGYDEIFLQGKSKGSTSYILSSTGALVQTLTNGYLNIDWSAAAYSASISGGRIQLTPKTSADDYNETNHNTSTGAVTSLQTAVTKPTIGGDHPRYVYKGETFTFNPTITKAAQLNAVSITPSWLGWNWLTETLSGTSPNTSGNEDVSVSVTFRENKTHSIEVGLAFTIRAIEKFTIVQNDYDVYLDSSGNLFLRSKDGLNFYKIGVDGQQQWMEKITSAEFNASGASLNSSYRVGFSDYNHDGSLDLIVYPESTSGDSSYAISSITSTTHTIISGEATEFLIADAPLVEPTVPDNQNVGVVLAEAGVSGGAASYNIPIAIPPGRAGMQPSISINYSSNGGNGVVGKGFSLSASSAISRCGSIMAIDSVNRGVNYTADDNFCLDGARLIKDGAYYYPELNPNLRVSLAGTAANPTSFTVELPSGIVKRYGGTSNNATQYAVGVDGIALTTAKTWAIYQESDLADNTIEYFYEDKGHGEFVLDKIKYTGSSSVTGNREVKFGYETRTDQSFAYMAGGRTSRAHRLNSITVKYDESVVNQYTLTYEYSLATKNSLLSSVKQCAFKGTEEKCLPATTFDWNNQASSYEFKKIASQSTNITQDWNGAHSYLRLRSFPDLDGDGFKELEIRKDNSLDYTSVDIDAMGNVNERYHGEDRITHYLIYFHPGYAKYEYHRGPNPVDFNRDGLTDHYEFINPTADNSNAEFAFISYADFDPVTKVPAREISTPTGLRIDRFEGQNSDWLPILPHVADVNGDGLVDLLHNGNSAVHTNKRALHLYLNTGTADQPRYDSGYQVIYEKSFKWDKKDYDFDGNGILDIFVRGSFLDNQPGDILFGYVENGVLTYETKQLGAELGFDENTRPGKNYFNFIDINGDGLKDYLFVPPSNRTWHYKINTGGQWGETVDTGVAHGVDKIFGRDPFLPKYVNTFKFGDWDNDGKLDILVPRPGDNWKYTPVAEYCIPSNLLERGGVFPVCATGAGLEDLYEGDADKDRSLYQYDKISFNTSADGTVALIVEETDLVLPGVGGFIEDVNGDGISDMVVVKAKYGSLDQLATPSVPTEFNDGDGIYVIFGKGAASSNASYGKRPDLLAKVENGFQQVSEWEYLPLTHPGLENESTPFYQTDYEVINGDDYRDYSHFVEGTHLVASYKTSDGIGGLNESRYFYKGAVYNHKGRGFQGFKQIIVDNPNGIRAVSNFHRMFPKAGKLESTRSCLKETLPSSIYNADCAADPLTESTFEYVAKITSSGKHYRVIPTLSESKTYSLAEHTSPVLTKSTTIAPNKIDDFGNILESVSTVDNGFGTTTVTTSSKYLYDSVSDWWINKLDESTVTTSTIETTWELYDLQLDSEKTVTTDIESYDVSVRKPSSILITPNTGKRSRVKSEYNIDGLISKVTTESPDEVEATDRVVKTFYSEDGYFAETVENDLGTITTIANPIHGQPDSTMDLNGIETTYKYDAFGRLEETNAPGLPVLKTRYAFCNNCDNLSNTNIKYKVTTYSAGAPESATYADMFNRTVLARTQKFDGNNVFVKTDFDNLGRVTFESVPSSSPTTTVGTTFNSYDVLGRLTQKQVEQTLGQSITTNYIYEATGGDHFPYTTKISLNSGDKVLYRTHSGNGQLMQTSDALATSGKTKYAYDGQGSPIVLQDANGKSIKAKYNALGQKLEVNDPNMGTKSFTYTGFGEVESETDAIGNQTTYFYDTLGRLKERAVSGPNESATSYFIFDKENDADDKCIGVVSREYKNDGTEFERTYHYDSLCRPVSVKTIIDGSQTFVQETLIDGNYGRPKAEVYPGGLTVGYEYSDEGYLSRVYNAQNNYTYREITSVDEQGNWTLADYANGSASVERKFYLQTGQMEYSSWSTNSSIQQKVSYLYDNYGNLDKQTAENHWSGLTQTSVETYSYDDMHRLLSSSMDLNGVATASVSYRYDAVGNIKKKTDFSDDNDNAYGYVSERSEANGWAGPNAVRTVMLANGAGTRTYNYDQNGNLISDGIRTISYNGFNKPVQISVSNSSVKINPQLDDQETGASVANLFYGSDQMRYKQTKSVSGETTTHLYIGKSYEHITTVSGSTTTIEEKSYVGDIAVVTEKTESSVTTSETTFYHRDRLGSMTAEVDSNGNVIRGHSFDAFGRPRSAMLEDKVGFQQLLGYSTNRGFTDHEHLDESQLIHMNGRAYDYNLGRFLSVDPFIQESWNSQSINPYSYILNNPLAGIDPTGYERRKNCYSPACSFVKLVKDIHRAKKKEKFNSLPKKQREKILKMRKKEAQARAATLAKAMNAINKFFKDRRKSTSNKGRNSDRIGEQKQVTKNNKDGKRREKETEEELKREHPESSVQREQYLRDKDGKISKDPETGEGRRIDHVVIDKNGNAERAVETTSDTAKKAAQAAKEDRIRKNGGTLVRDRETKKLVDFEEVLTETKRRK